MNTRHSPAVTLGWVREDIDRMVAQLRAQVEHLASVQGVRDEAVTETVERLEDLHHTLHLLNLTGAALLADEMWRLGQCLVEHRVDRRDRAFSALMEALVVLPAYLDRLQAGHHDLPLLLMPVINQLRTGHGAHQVQESALFSADLEVDLPELELGDSVADAAEPVTAIAQQVRHQYEKAMMDWLADQDSRDLLAPLLGICETLLHRVKRTDIRRTWWIAGEILGALADNKLRNDANIRRLLARLHLNIKTLSEGGEDAVDPAATDALSQALLFRAAQAKPNHPGLILLRKRFDLKSLLPDQEGLLRAQSTLSGKDRDMYASLGAAIHDEITLIKDALDLEVRTGQADRNRRKLSREALSRMQETLHMLAMTDTAAAIEALMPTFDQSASLTGDELTAALMPLAEKFLAVESAILEQIETLGEPLPVEDEHRFIELPAHEFRKMAQTLMAETVRSMHQFEETIRARLDGDQDKDPSRPIEEIAGALELLGEKEAAGLAWRLQKLTQRLLGNAYSAASFQVQQLDWYTEAVAALELYLAAIRDRQAPQARLAAVLMDRLEWLEGDKPKTPPKPKVKAVTAPELAVEAAAPVTTGLQADSEHAAKASATSTPISSEAVVIDPELLGIFLEEYDEVTESLQQHLPAWLSRLDDVTRLTEVRRSFHTLKGSGRMVGAFELGDFCWQIENMLNALLDSRIKTFSDAASTVKLAQAVLPALKQRLMNQSSGLTHEVIAAIGVHAESVAQGQPIDWSELRAVLPGYLSGMLPESDPSPATKTKPQIRKDVASDTDFDTDNEMSETLRKELGENLHLLESLFEAAAMNKATIASQEQVRAAHTIAGSLALAPQGRDVEVARALEAVLGTHRERRAPFNNEAVWTLGSFIAFVQSRLDRLEGDAEAEPPEGEDSLLREIARIRDWFEMAEPLSEPSAEPPEAAPAAATAEQETQAEAPIPSDPEPAEPEPTAPAKPTLADEIIVIFLDEAREVLGRCDSLLNTWRDNLHAMPLVQNLQREIHTFKGGARMAGLETLGLLSHAMEELLERTAAHEIPPSTESVDALERGCDQLSAWLDQLNRGETPDPGSALELFLQQIEHLSSEEAAGTAVEAYTPPVEPKVLTDIPETEVLPEGKTDEVVGQQQIRVDAELLDDLIKSAGEINIFRSRLERQVGNLRNNLGEFNETIGRLRDQFRKLDIETEAQMRSSYRDAAIGDGEEFDPLELDRFSSIQQLSRGLSESVADLLNLEELLEDAARQADTLLTQQSRVSTELQEGLMKTRMVPFGSVAPRLRRLVRSAAAETAKKARLKLMMAGSSDQLDRNILEHITAPLEHMLRNAIAHGIESPQERKKAGKEPEGEIRVTVESEATEFVIRVEDDGAGINREAIRQRAIERGLIDESAHPPPQQLFELILGSGFSTSATVTGLAGRGVGMDVVSSEIKQIGGSLEIQSEEGQGSCFTVRIPFTLAVMLAIGVRAGEQRYLIPLASVSGVARMAPADYQALLQQERPLYEFSGQQYPVLELEPLLGEPARPLGADNVSLLMIKTGDQRAAFRVPELLGHREVVIKPVGPQITSVPGILGGTVTGDGRVVVILDPGPIIRQALLHGVRPTLPERHVSREPSRKVAMIVDDSITMRKVNSRVLEGQDIEAITAKDGLDALEQMQDRVPDILLLDIEMPRMDGFQLAEHVRSDARLRHIPIIMITSRSGQKHRDRAAQAGANAYLTKPYKESELLSTVYRLLGIRK